MITVATYKWSESMHTDLDCLLFHVGCLLAHSGLRTVSKTQVGDLSHWTCYAIKKRTCPEIYARTI